MTYQIDATDTSLLASAPAKAPRGNLLRRLLDGLIEAQQRRAERAVANYISVNGGRLTDDLERRISQRFGSPVL